MAFARALLTASPPGSTDHIEADLCDPDTLVGMARATPDFAQPVAILLMQVLGHIGDRREGDDAAARAVVDRLKAALPPGGFLVISEAADTSRALNAALRFYNRTGTVLYRARRPDQIMRFFDGLELAAPGVVPIRQWRPDPSPFAPPVVAVWGGAARKHLPRASRPLASAVTSPAAARTPGPGPAGPGHAVIVIVISGARAHH